ncbi:MAG: prepilin-type N-terminal cleavage/methylation domain-containing protein [Akkermansiaceae bacterium]
MKNLIPRRKCGFTLVELLVVIAIIAVLAGAGFAAGNAAIQKARRTTALATATSIEAAVNNFHTEYGSMPKSNLTGDDEVNTKDDVDLLKVLLGIETVTTPLNTRAVKFLSVREGKAGKNGLIYNSTGTTVTGLFDPWGGPYYIALDGNYDEKIEVKPSASPKTTLNGRRAAVWSNGADAVGGTGGAVGDDVKTW